MLRIGKESLSKLCYQQLISSEGKFCFAAYSGMLPKHCRAPDQPFNTGKNAFRLKGFTSRMCSKPYNNKSCQCMPERGAVASSIHDPTKQSLFLRKHSGILRASQALRVASFSLTRKIGAVLQNILIGEKYVRPE
jgi:hypothetical protein